MNNQKKLENKKKLRHGTAAIVLTAVVVVAVIIVNVVFTKLAYNNNWYVDMTESSIYGLSDDGRALLDTIDQSREIKVHFCTPIDKLEQNDYSKMAFELVKQISSEYSNISYDYIDILRDAAVAYKYKKDSSDTVTSSNIIIESGTEFRKFTLDQLFYYDPNTYEYWAFHGEARLISAMVAVTQAETPVAYLSTGHGEYNDSTAFAQLLTDAGYEIKTIDLTKQDFEEDARLLVVMNPIKDFQGDPDNDPALYSEIEKLADWLSDGGNLMIFRGGLEHTGTAPVELPELDQLLAEWGISFKTETLLDSSNSVVMGSSQGTSYVLEGKYAEGDSFGAKVVSDMASLASPPKVVVPYARPIELLFDYKNDRETTAVVYSQSTALSTSETETKSAGEVPIIAASRAIRIIDNVETYNYVYAIGSLGFAEANYLNASYANNDVLYRMMRDMGRAQVPVNLDLKVFEDEALDINIDEAEKITWALVLVVPAVIFTVGIIVYIRRKHA